MRFAIQAGFTDGTQFEGYLKDSFDMLYAEGEAGAPKMLSIGLHCRLIGRPEYAMALKRALDHMAAHEGVWFATRAEIAEHWAREHPPTPRQRPSEMDRESFVAEFGGIFEHSPWIAERAHDLELGPAHDCAAGVHNALARIFRSVGVAPARGSEGAPGSRGQTCRSEASHYRVHGGAGVGGA